MGCAPDDVHIGMAVQAFVEDVDDELKLPIFRPAGDPDARSKAR